MKKDEEGSEEEQIDIEKVLAETKPNLEIAEAGEENRSKKTAKKKPAKKKVEKTEKKAEEQKEEKKGE